MMKIGHNLDLPLNAVTEKFAFLGRTGSGKSYGAMKMAEEMLDDEDQIVILDPVGVWWGLRLKRDKKTPAYSIPVFGGLHGDIPIEAGAGALIADIVVDYHSSAVIDVSGFLLSEQRRFATDFATQFFHRKKSSRSAVHLFIEEAQEFVPQHVRGDSAKMVGAYERLLKLGRNFGIGATLISQRPQSVNKDVLNQAECLFCFQMTGPHERKTIESWITEKGINEDISSVLPHLKVGHAHVWSPQWLNISKTVHILEKKTADISSTPKPGEKVVKPKELSPVELVEIQERMKSTIERAKAQDPRELQKHIRELENKLAAKPKDVPVAQVVVEEKPVLANKQIAAIEKIIGSMFKLEARFEAHSSELNWRADEIRIAMQKISPSGGSSVGRASREDRRLPVTPPQKVAGSSPAPRAISSNREIPIVGGGLRRMMIALAQRPGLSKKQLGVRAGLSSSSGTFGTYLSTMRKANWISGDGERISLTDSGLEALGPYDPLPEGEGLYQFWLSQLGEAAGSGRMLKALHDAYPSSLTKEELGVQASISHSSGTFGTYLSTLRRLELVTGKSELKASDELF